MLVGERTYGKGRIQSAYHLTDGSTLLVTVASYRTPSAREIDRVGLKPDVACSPDAPGGGRRSVAASGSGTDPVSGPSGVAFESGGGAAHAPSPAPSPQPLQLLVIPDSAARAGAPRAAGAAGVTISGRARPGSPPRALPSAGALVAGDPCVIQAAQLVESL